MDIIRTFTGKALSLLMVLSVVGASVGVGFSSKVSAETKYRRVYDAQAKQYYYVPDQTLKGKAKASLHNPVVKDAVVGAALGAATGVISGRTSLLKGVGVGALVGAGTGLIDKSTMLNGKPVIKTALKGAAIGTGASSLLERSPIKGAAAGAAAGAGLQLFKDFLNRDSRNNPQH